MFKIILVSACLCGVNCKYNGLNNLKEPILKLVREGNAMLVCPEQLGGLETPRPPSEIVNGTGKEVLIGNSKVLSNKGIDVSKQFIKGANEVLNLAKLTNANLVILKAKSPSCGIGKIYDGTFNGILKEGNGVTAELLIQNGFKVINEDEFGGV